MVAQKRAPDEAQVEEERDAEHRPAPAQHRAEVEGEEPREELPGVTKYQRVAAEKTTETSADRPPGERQAGRAPPLAGALGRERLGEVAEDGLRTAPAAPDPAPDEGDEQEDEGDGQGREQDDEELVHPEGGAEDVELQARRRRSAARSRPAA